MRGFNEKQKKELFNLAKNAKKQGVSLCEVFNSFAKKYGKAPGSVRNFYYKSIAEGCALGLKVKTLKPFSEAEESKLISEVLAERKKTGSLKSALLNVAGGDKVLAMRYQNKFANLLKKQRAKIMREVILQRERFGKSFNPYLFKREQEKREKLKKEINALIETINEKCKNENLLLKKKLIEYEKISFDLSNDDCDKNHLFNYFSLLKNKKIN